MSSAGAG